MPDDLFKKLPKYGKLNLGTDKVQLCHSFCYESKFCSEGAIWLLSIRLVCFSLSRTFAQTLELLTKAEIDAL